MVVVVLVSVTGMVDCGTVSHRSVKSLPKGIVPDWRKTETEIFRIVTQ